jgi:hypothetical protein
VLHLFYVYSGIVARLVPHIIRHLDLDPADILIVNDRSQTSASTAPGLRTENAGFRQQFNRWRNLPQDWSTILHNSRRIRQLVDGREFVAYLPSPSDRICQQILWHPLCQQYWLTEEGLGSYCPPGVSPVHLKPFTRFQLLQLGARVRGLGRISPTVTDYPHWPSKYAGCFGSNALTFPGFPAPVINLDHPIYQAVATPITRLVIFDDFSCFSTSLQAIYLETIRQVISTEHREGDHWAYKLHPRCAAWPALLAQVKRVFDETLPPGTPCDALPSDTSAEDIGISPGVTTYGYMSSCLFYIHQGGGRVASFKNLIERREPAFDNFWQRFFPPVLDPLVSGYQMLEIPLPR